MLSLHPAVRSRLPSRVILRGQIAREKLHEALCSAWLRTLGEEPTLRRPIFIVGCPRSGTTIFSQIFATHPWVAEWSEAGRIWDPYFYYDPDADHCWEAERANDYDRRRLHALFEFHRRREGKPRFVNKHPRNSVRVDYLDRLFPDAYFVHVVRDGRAVANSLLTITRREKRRQEIPFGGFCKPPNWRSRLREDPAEQAALQWDDIVRYVLRRRAGLDLEGRYCEVRYEDMCRDPKETFTRVFAAVGLPASREHMGGIPDRMQDRGGASALAERDREVVTRIQRPLLRELGYDA